MVVKNNAFIIFVTAAMLTAFAVVALETFRQPGEWLTGNFSGPLNLRLVAKNKPTHDFPYPPPKIKVVPDSEFAPGRSGPPPYWKDDYLYRDLDTPPILIYDEGLKYPEKSTEARVEGDVIVMVYINEEGNVELAEVQSSPGNVSLEKAALEAAGKLRFKPGLKNAEPVATWYPVIFQFRLP